MLCYLKKFGICTFYTCFSKLANKEFHVCVKFVIHRDGMPFVRVFRIKGFKSQMPESIPLPLLYARHPQRGENPNPTYTRSA